MRYDSYRMTIELPSSKVDALTLLDMQASICMLADKEGGTFISGALGKIPRYVEYSFPYGSKNIHTVIHWAIERGATKVTLIPR